MMMKWIKARQIRILTLCCILSIMLLNPLSAYASESDYVDVASEEGVVTDGYLQDGYYDDVIGVEKFVAPIEISNQKDKSREYQHQQMYHFTFIISFIHLLFSIEHFFMV